MTTLPAAVGHVQNRDTRRPVPARPYTPAAPVAPPPPVAMPEWHWLLEPSHGRGYLSINGTIYQTTEIGFTFDNGQGGRLWDLTKADGTTYRLCADHDADLTCDCPDATYRERTCKHVLALQAGFNELNRLERLRNWLAATLPIIAGCPF
jgi:hypothetical protein